MKKLFFVLAVLVSLSFGGEKTIFEVCNDKFCYEQILENVKNYEWKTDYTGKKFLRVYFYDKRLLDIKGENLTIKKKKKK